MKIVQTLWTADKDLLTNDFGWLSPSYHIMSWTLSCLKLREFYNKVLLFTDSNANNILNNKLKVPYTSVVNQYNKLKCEPTLWALPKILTYASQGSPFIHVDGDVFISRKFHANIEKASIIVQNKEIGTYYYKNMMSTLSSSLKHIPIFLKRELDKMSIPSFNMGVFGGKDIPLIQNFCKSSLKFYKDNEFDKCSNISINVNILFEQILFYAICKQAKKEVTCVFNEIYFDNGYMFEQFCDFSAFGYKKNYLHIIGGYKKNFEICEMISRTLHRLYPEYYFKILSLFKKLPNTFKDGKEFHNIVFNKNEFLKDLNDAILKIRGRYLKRELNFCMKRWKYINYNYLLQFERASIDYLYFFYLSKNEQLNIKFNCHPYLYIAEDSFEWPKSVKKRMERSTIRGKWDTNDASGIAFIPEIDGTVFRIIAIDKLCYNILVLLKKSMSLKSLLNDIQTCFLNKKETNREEIIFQLTIIKLRFLLFNKCLFIVNNNI